jgi:hypothetical protein
LSAPGRNASSYQANYDRSFTPPPGAQQIQTGTSDLPLGGPTTFPTPGLVARYIWYVLPSTGPTRYFTLCEMQVMQRQPFTWRKLSGTYNAALRGAAKASSVLNGYGTAWGDGLPLRAVDGLVTNRGNNAQPFTVAHTTNMDTPTTWWTVDMGRVVDVQSINVYARYDCCTGRNKGIKFYVGLSDDETYDQQCLNAPNDITPDGNCPLDMGLPNCLVKSQPAGQACRSGADVVSLNTLQPPLTACYKYFTCPLRGRYLKLVKQTPVAGLDANFIMLGEVQVIANKLLDMPSARSGMATAVFGGCLVVFGGLDVNGVTNNEVRLFDMLRNLWVPAFTPLGTTPSARSFAALALLPSPLAAAGGASNSLALFSGASQSGQLNDVNILSFPACPALDPTGVLSSSCVHGNTVCYITCAAYALSTNGAAPVVCQSDGTWRGTFPACQTQTPSAPQGLSAVVNPATGAVTVSWQPPASLGYKPQLIAYDIITVSTAVIEDFSLGKFPDPSAWYLAPPYSSTVVPVTPWVPGLKSGGNSYDFYPSAVLNLPALRVVSDYGSNCWTSQMQCAQMLRNFPPYINVAGSWSAEVFVEMDVTNIIAQSGMGATIGVYDTTKGSIDPSTGNPAGLLMFYLGLRQDGNANGLFSVGVEQSQGYFSSYSASNGRSNGYFKIVRDATVSVTNPTWRFFYKWSANSAWQLFGTQLDASMPFGGINPAGLKIALSSRNWNGSQRQASLFSNFRVGVLGAGGSLGSHRTVAAPATSTVIYSLPPGPSYNFQVAAQTAAGWSPYSAPFGAALVPTLKTQAPGTLLVSQGRQCWLSSYYGSPPTYPCSNCVDSILNNL